MKKIPYGKIDYQKLIKDDCYYVDKTMYLEKLENNDDTLIYLRPGRFGKSLFTSMMSYYYDVKSADLFESLFKETYVYKHPTKGKNNYYILKFDFSGLETALKETIEIREEFKECVIRGIENFLNDYNLEYEINKDRSSASIAKDFFSYFKGLKLENKIYIMIDEYDNFTNAILEGDTKRFKSVVGNEGAIKSFYTAIKEYIGLGVIGRFFATGICPITLNSMTTGFNIATDISTDIRFNSMIGLTHDEVKKLLNEVVEKKDRESIYNLMIENYDGYLFNEDSNEKVFNATLVMYLLNYYEDFKTIPKNVMDNNIAFNYEKIGNLLELQNNTFYKETIEEMLSNELIKGVLKTKFDLSLELNEDDLKSLLYYFGYLTVTKDEYGGLLFKIPNQVMKELYGRYFIKKLKDEKIEIEVSSQREAIEEVVRTGKIEKLNKCVSEFMKKMSKRNFIDFNEKNLKFIYFMMLIDSGYYYTNDEYEVNNGYIDIYLRKKNENIPNNVIIELKYIKKKDYNEKILNSKIEEGRRQLEEYSQDERLATPLKKYVVVFSGYECKKIIEV